MDDKKLALFTKYLHNTCTSHELQLVWKDIATGKYQDEWEEVLKRESERYLTTTDEPTALDPDHLKEMHTRLMKEVLTHQTKPIRHQRWWLRAVAAILIICVWGAIAYFYSNSPSHIIKRQTLMQPDTMVRPGKDDARLQLANGKELVLNELDTGKLVDEVGMVVNKTKEGLLVFKANTAQAEEETEIRYHTLVTPRGGQYQLVLADGTHVWLNAQSKLHFPTRFDEQNRTVTLEGEAYFAVAHTKNLAPFIVKTAQQDIQVLGTEFNVTAYNDEPQQQVCLVNGAVKLNGKDYERQMQPGQVAILSPVHGLQVHHADISNYIAWKNGLFAFKEEHIYSLMNKIARWYDVEVSYQGDMTGKVFSGTFSRFADVRDVLNILEATGTVKITLKERRIMVSL